MPSLASIAGASKPYSTLVSNAPERSVKEPGKPRLQTPGSIPKTVMPVKLLPPTGGLVPTVLVLQRH
jgi:hypothetical protein